MFKNGEEVYNEREAWTGAMTNQVPATLFSHFMFRFQGEEIQQQQFLEYLEAFDELREGANWTFGELFAWLEDDATKRSDGNGARGAQIRVWEAIRRRKKRKPDWIDYVATKTRGYGDLLNGGTATQPNTLLNYLKPGHVVISRLPPSADGYEYGLYLTFVLNQLFAQRQRAKSMYPLLVVIDEAQRIFNGDRPLRQTAEGTLYRVLREGRSKQIGFVISVQSAGQVPDLINDNLNSKIIHRQNTADALKELASDIPKETLNTVLSFGPGQALVKLFEARGTFRGNMLPSPFLLTKSGSATTWAAVLQQDGRQA